MHQMMKSMRNTLSGSTLTEESQGRKIFTDMLDQEQTMQNAGRTSTGLAGLIYKQLKEAEGETNNFSEVSARLHRESLVEKSQVSYPQKRL